MASLRTPSGSEPIASDTQPSGAHNETGKVQNVGVMLWEAAKKEWLPASSGNTKDGESAAEALPVQNLLLNQAGAMDRQRTNEEVTLLASGAHTTPQTSSVQTNINARGVLLLLIVTVVGEGSLGVFIHGPGGYGITEWRGITVSTNCLAYPGCEGSTPGMQGAPPSRSVALPRIWTAVVVPTGSSSWTYSLIASTIL